jgi:hypothetical protein
MHRSSSLRLARKTTSPKGHLVAIEPIDIMVRAVLTGRSPLVMHHPRTADPDDPYVQQIREITAKRTNMTAEDRKRKEGLQWRACLYTEEVKADSEPEPQERLIVPAMWLFRSLEEGGKTLGKGTASKGAAAIRSITIADPWFLLGYDGSQNITELEADHRFRWRTIVNGNPSGGGKSLVPSARPIFPSWQVETRVYLVTDMGLGWEDFEKAFRAAGAMGIGDARKLGYGRFSVKLTKLK